eukprot:scaffold2002_cov116-Skeletonema_dohrnii-CCMP3373.AAC.3
MRQLCHYQYYYSWVRRTTCPRRNGDAKQVYGCDVRLGLCLWSVNLTDASPCCTNVSDKSTGGAGARQLRAARRSEERARVFHYNRRCPPEPFMNSLYHAGTTTITMSSSDNNNNPSSTGGGGLPLSSRTVNSFVMNSSESTLSAPDTDSNSTNGIYLGLRLTDDTAEETDEELSTDQVAIIFSFLSPEDIMQRFRRVCTTWRDAAKMAVPSSKFVVRSERSYNAMILMSTELPNLQQLQILGFGGDHKYSDGEDPNERLATVTARHTTHDINIISNFFKLRVLHINYAELNGRYPVLFNFPLLNELSISNCSSLKFDLDMLVGLSSLKVLKLGIGTATYWDRDSGISRLTGNLSSLRVLRDTIEKVCIINSQHIRGNFMDLADFPLLKELDLFRTGVTGDIRNIREHDFPALESLRLPSAVIGGLSYQFQSVAE